MPSSEAAVLHPRHCRRCQRPFAICCSCDRGHCYGSHCCSQAARREQRKAAKTRHQKTPHGREDNARHQREHRARRRAGTVRDRSSQPESGSATLPAQPPQVRAQRALIERPWEVACETRVQSPGCAVWCATAQAPGRTPSGRRG